MKQPFWKRWLSYLFEWHIESAPSDINPHLYVSLRKGRYLLSSANAVYSYGDLYNNFSKIFRKLDWEKKDIQEVLVLGFGLGSIPFMLEKVFKKNYRYTGVEIDENVLYLANKYVLPELKSSIEIFLADAYAFVFQDREQFDLIALDIFLDDKIPPAFEETKFLQQLKKLLSPNGILLYNRLSLSKKDVRLTNTFFEEKFKAVFPDATFLDVGGNWMLMNRSGVLI